MITGILSKFFWDSITESGEFQFQNWPNQLLKPLVVSPLLFEAVFFLARETTPSYFLLIFAYQNGFFWQTVFHGGKKREE
jgi:hypothetical protein